MSDGIDRESFISGVAEGLKKSVLLALGDAAPLSQREADRLWVRLRDAFLFDSLDIAWVDTETALPKEWWFRLSSRGLDGYCAYAYSLHSAVYMAWGSGPTPAAALRALTAKLREMVR